MTIPADVQNTIDSRKHRWNEFLKPDAVPGFLFKVNYPDHRVPPLPSSPPHWPDRAKERVEYKWLVYQRALERVAEVDDDGVPYIDMSTGTEIFAEAFGCRVARPTDNMPFALPLIHSASEVAGLPVPELSRSSLAYLFDMADELRRRAGPAAVVKMVDVQSPIDIAALIWGKESFFVAMVEAPAAVKELAAKTSVLLTDFLDEWFRRYGKEHVSHFPDYFMSSGMTLSEDEIGSISVDMFREFVRPQLVALSSRYGGLGLHCCADARHQWANLQSIPGLKLLNLVNPPTRKGEEYLGDAFKFFARTCAQWHGGWVPSAPSESWPEGYPHESRIVLELWAEDQPTAMGLAARMQEARAKKVSALAVSPGSLLNGWTGIPACGRENG